MRMRWAAVCLIAGAGCLGPDSDGALLERAKRVGAPWEQTEPERSPSAAIIAWWETRGKGKMVLLDRLVTEEAPLLDAGQPPPSVHTDSMIFSIAGIASAARRQGLQAETRRDAELWLTFARHAHGELARQADLPTAYMVLSMDTKLLKEAGKRGLISPDIVVEGPVAIDASQALRVTALHVLNLIRSSEQLQGIDAVAEMLRRHRAEVTDQEDLSFWDVLEERLSPPKISAEIPEGFVPISTGWPEDPGAKAAARAFLECMVQVFSKPEDQRMAELERLADRQADRPGQAAEFILWINMQSMRLREARLAHWAELQKARKSLQEGQS
jgi:hypothetical protein